MPGLIPLYGKEFGRLTVVDRAPNDKRGKPQWLCRCECGEYATVLGGNLKTGNTQSCGCRKREIIQERQCLRSYEALYRNFVRSAAHPASITYEQFVEFTKLTECHYCGDPVSWDGTAYNLDRTDNDQGYTVDNCVVCCARCNIGKSKNFTYEEWREIGDVIRGWKK